MKLEDRRRLRVAVLAGGSSDEREVSLASGANVLESLRQAGYERVSIVNPADTSFIASMTGDTYDVAFNALHGAVGEDGTIQGFLEFIGMPYTGSGVTASACAADKHLAKTLYRQVGIPVPEGVAIERGSGYDVDEIARCVGTTCFVKPALNGSSYGISKVMRIEDMKPAIERAFEYGEKVLVEQCIEGTEVTVGVYGSESPRALPVVEICFNGHADFYDLSIKYTDPTDIHKIPARLSVEDYARVQELAVRAHVALGCRGITRSDFIVSQQGPVILETNTIPGMTEASLVPDELRHSDLSLPEACDGLIQMALEAWEKKKA